MPCHRPRNLRCRPRARLRQPPCLGCGRRLLLRHRRQLRRLRRTVCPSRTPCPRPRGPTLARFHVKRVTGRSCPLHRPKPAMWGRLPQRRSCRWSTTQLAHPARSHRWGARVAMRCSGRPPMFHVKPRAPLAPGLQAKARSVLKATTPRSASLKAMPRLTRRMASRGPVVFEVTRRAPRLPRRNSRGRLPSSGLTTPRQDLGFDVKQRRPPGTLLPGDRGRPPAPPLQPCALAAPTFHVKQRRCRRRGRKR